MIDIIRTSASRPELLRCSTESILKNLKFSGVINWFLNEDVLNSKASKECVDYSHNLNIYKEIQVNERPKKHTNAFYWLFERVSSPYFMFWEDDYELLQIYEFPECKSTYDKYKWPELSCKKCKTSLVELPTNVDLLINLMETHNNINEICFPKRDILPDKPDFNKKPITIDGTNLTVCHHWYISPAIWRTAFIRPYVEKMKKTFRPTPDGFGWHWALNDGLKGKNISRSAEWVESNIGTYYLGHPRRDRRVMHIGTGDKSLRSGKYKWQ